MAIIHGNRKSDDDDTASELGHYAGMGQRVEAEYRRYRTALDVIDRDAENRRNAAVQTFTARVAAICTVTPIVTPEPEPLPGLAEPTDS